MLLERVELGGDVVHDRQVVIHEHIENEVQQMRWPAPQEIGPALDHLLGLGDGGRGALVEGHQEALAEEDVHLPQRWTLASFPAGRVNDQVEIRSIVVDLGTVRLRHHVLDRQRVNVERRQQLGDLGRRFAIDVDPGGAAALGGEAHGFYWIQLARALLVGRPGLDHDARAP